MKKILAVTLIPIAIGMITSVAAFAQKKGADTVVVELAKTSRMVFTIKDKSDLEQLKQYDFQAMFDDILKRLENNDSVIVVANPAEDTVVTVAPENTEAWASNDIDTNHDDDDDYDDRHNHRKHRGTTHSFNLDVGLSNFLESGKFPDEEGQPYAVQPWGSWSFGLSSVQRTAFGKGFYLEWALGVSWYDFKFEQDQIMIVKDDSGISFEENLDEVSFVKSRLEVTYINVSAIPMFSFGEDRGRSWKWRSYNSGFRIGAGPYVGYRVGSSTKQVYKEDGDKQKIKNKDNFYLENMRYGVRLQIGVRSADFFFNYDINELFAAGKGPKLNALSFGITF
jgi:hypothetical protein